jgi:hypothetical protein
VQSDRVELQLGNAPKLDCAAESARYLANGTEPRTTETPVVTVPKVSPIVPRYVRSICEADLLDETLTTVDHQNLPRLWTGGRGRWIAVRCWTGGWKSCTGDDSSTAERGISAGAPMRGSRRAAAATRSVTRSSLGSVEPPGGCACADEALRIPHSPEQRPRGATSVYFPITSVSGKQQGSFTGLRIMNSVRVKSLSYRCINHRPSRPIVGSALSV